MTPTERQSFVATEREADTAPGRRLREAREAANLSLAEVASQLHLERRSVEFLERDEYDKLHAPTFVRGYLSSYARLLRLPERPILEAYDRRGFGPPALVPDIAQKPQVQVSDLPVRMVTYLIASMLVLLVILWWQSRQTPVEEEPIAADSTREASPPPSAAATELAAGAAPTPEEASAAGRRTPRPSNVPEATTSGQPSQVTRTAQTFDRPGGEDAAQATGGPVPSPSGSGARTVTELATAPREPPGSDAAAGGNAPAEASTPRAEVSVPPSGDAAEGTPPDAALGRVTVPTPDEEPTRPAGEGGRVGTGADRAVAAAAPARVSEEPLPSASSVPVDGDDVLRMDFSRPSWVEVYDREGYRLYYSLAKEGSEILLRGAGPMRVLLGDVEGAEIVYNGEPFDLGRYAGRKVARFVVGEGTPAPARRPAPTTEPQREEDAAASATRPAVAEAPDAEMATGGDTARPESP